MKKNLSKKELKITSGGNSEDIEQEIKRLEKRLDYILKKQKDTLNRDRFANRKQILYLKLKIKRLKSKLGK